MESSNIENMSRTMDTCLLLSGTQRREYLSPSVFALFANIYQAISDNYQNPGSVVTLKDPQQKAIKSLKVGLSLGDGKLKLYNRDDITQKIGGNTMYGLPGTVHVLLNIEGEPEQMVDIVDILAITSSKVATTVAVPGAIQSNSQSDISPITTTGDNIPESTLSSRRTPSEALAIH